MTFGQWRCENLRKLNKIEKSSYRISIKLSTLELDKPKLL